MSEKRYTMRDFVEQTPEQVLKNIDRSKELTKSLVKEYTAKNYKRVIIVACGSSSNGSYCAVPFLEKVLKKPVLLIPPFNFVHFKNQFNDNDFIVVCSQSGKSTNAIEALELIKSKGHRTIGITTDMDSDFHDICDVTVDWGVVFETVGYVTKGVVTLALFFDLFAVEAQLALGKITEKKANEYKEEMRKAMQAHLELQASTNKFVETHNKEIYAFQTGFTISAGANLATATEAALKISETMKIHVTAYECEEFLHGPDIPIDPRYFVIAYDTGNAKANKRIAQIVEGCREVCPTVVYVRNTVSKHPDDIYTKVRVMDELMPLAYLAVAPLIANFGSRDITLPAHPLYSKLTSKCATKSTVHKSKWQAN